MSEPTKWEVYDRGRSNVVLGVVGGLATGAGCFIALLATGSPPVLLLGALVDALVLGATGRSPDSRAGGVAFVLCSVLAVIIGAVAIFSLIYISCGAGCD